jgi:hypothetical protein
VDAYTEMVKDVVNRFYTGVSRYTTSAFLRMKLGDALKKRDVASKKENNRQVLDLRAFVMYTDTIEV